VDAVEADEAALVADVDASDALVVAVEASLVAVEALLAALVADVAASDAFVVAVDALVDALLA
jgi:hypothetical protein